MGGSRPETSTRCGSMLGQRRRWWDNIKPTASGGGGANYRYLFDMGPIKTTLGQCLVFSGQVFISFSFTLRCGLQLPPSPDFDATSTRPTQNICITFVQYRPNVFDVGSTLYKCYTNLCFVFAGYVNATPPESRLRCHLYVNANDLILIEYPSIIYQMTKLRTSLF